MLDLKNILIARDFDHSSDKAVEYATDLAEALGATLHVVYGALQQGHPDNVPPEAEIPDSVFLEQLKSETRPLLNGTPARETLRIQYAVARGLNRARGIVQYAAEHEIDLIVTGSHERTALGRLFHPSVAQKVARSATCPVSIVRSRTHTSAPPERLSA